MEDLYGYWRALGRPLTEERIEKAKEEVRETLEKAMADEGIERTSEYTFVLNYEGRNKEHLDSEIGAHAMTIGVKCWGHTG